MNILTVHGDNRTPPVLVVRGDGTIFWHGNEVTTNDMLLRALVDAVLIMNCPSNESAIRLRRGSDQARPPLPALCVPHCAVPSSDPTP
jgi:hypothetical protein